MLLMMDTPWTLVSHFVRRSRIAVKINFKDTASSFLDAPSLTSQKRVLVVACVDCLSGLSHGPTQYLTEDERLCNVIVVSAKTTRAGQMAHVLYNVAEMAHLCLFKAALIEGQIETWYATVPCHANRMFTAVKRTIAMAKM